MDLKLTISVVDDHVAVDIGEGVTMNEAAHCFFECLDKTLPGFFLGAGYVKKPVDTD